MTELYAIWWTDQRACDLMIALCNNRDGVVPDHWPEYLKSDFQTRAGLGRHADAWARAQQAFASGTLTGPCILNSFDQGFPYTIEWRAQEEPFKSLADLWAGIVIRSQDVPMVHGAPGWVSDIQVRPLGRWYVPPPGAGS